MRLKYPQRSVGPTFYEFNYKLIYADYARLVFEFGWNPDLLRSIPLRERKYWMDVVKWRTEEKQWQARQQAPLGPAAWHQGRG